MNIIAHRRNTVAELIATSHRYGVEVDIRSHGTDLIIQHDPFVAGEFFDDWINAYQHGTLILNVKEEGLESRLIALMEERNIQDYFFLDQSFPFLVKSAKLAQGRSAVRVSEFESVETAIALAGQINWVWVDCFTSFPLNNLNAQRLVLAGFKLCIVSPELQGRDADSEIPALFNLLNQQSIVADAVCTKHADLWERLLA